MKPKTLVALAVVLVVLVVLVVIKQAKEQPLPIEEAVELSRLLPDGTGKADIARIELYSGGKPEEKVTLSRVPDDVDAWQIDNHFNAPVDGKKIGDFLDMLLVLKGEIRHQDVSEEGLRQYNLADDQAFHVLGYKKDDANPIFHVLTGKQADYKQVFARAAGTSAVFVVDKSPRRDAGIWQEDTDKAPEPAVWVDKTIAKIEQDKISRLELTTPNRRLVFEKREKPKPEEPKPESEDDSSAEEEKRSESPPEYEWVLAEGGPGKPFKQTSLDSLLRSFENLTAVDVADPAKKGEWGLDSPAFVCTITRSDVTEPLVLEGGRPDPAKDGYVRVAGRSRDTVYQVSQYNFDRMFALGKAAGLFDLDGLSLAKDDIVRVEIAQPERDVVLVKKDGKWAVEHPALDLETQSYTLDTVAGTFASWKPADYGDAAEGTGLDASTRKLTCVLSSGERHVLELGADSPALDGAYARLDGGGAVLVMSRADLNKVFVTPKDIYQRKLLDVSEGEIAAVEVERAEGSFALARKKAEADDGDKWDLTVGDESLEADANAVDSLLMALTDFEAEDILVAEKELGETAQATLRVTEEEGARHTFVFGEEKDGKCRLLLVEKGIVFVVNAEDLAEIMPEAATLKPEPAPVPTDLPEEAGDEVQPDQGSVEEAAAVETAPTAEPEALSEPSQSDEAAAPVVPSAEAESEPSETGPPEPEANNGPSASGPSTESEQAPAP